jgi:hypothetical protein
VKLRAALLILAGLLLALWSLLPARSWVSSARPVPHPTRHSALRPVPVLPAPLPRAGTVLLVDGGVAIVESVEQGVVTLIEADRVTGEMRRRRCVAAACPARRQAASARP